MKKTALSSLLHPRELPEFLSAFEKNEPFVVHHGLADLQDLAELPFLKSLGDLLNCWPKKIMAHLPDVRDESSAIETNAIDAQKLFTNGMGLLFNEAQEISPVLVRWLEEIRQELGISAMTYSRCLIYATPKDKGTAPHFDQNINFVVQIHGHKTWYMAPNESVQNPLTRHTMSSEPDPELASYIEKEMPVSMPASAQKIVLKPGSVLFVPRGYWHSTEAQEDSLALNFTFTAPTWIDLLTAALRSRLSLSVDWRETANGVADPSRRESAEINFETLLETLVEDLPNWKAQDILAATDGPISGQ